MKYNEFKDRIKEEYAKRFPESLANVYIFKCLGLQDICINCYLAANQKEEISGYFENDMFSVRLSVELPKIGKFDAETDELPRTLRLKWSTSSVATRPEVPWMVYGRQSIPFRMTSGSPEKLISAFGKYVDRLKKTVVEIRKDGKLDDSHEVLFNQKVA